MGVRTAQKYFAQSKTHRRFKYTEKVLYVLQRRLIALTVVSDVLCFDLHCRLKEDRLRFVCNLEVQLLLKQGQVEVDPGPFIPDYKHSLLLHRNVVEDLNAKIRVLGLYIISMSIVHRKVNLVA